MKKIAFLFCFFLTFGCSNVFYNVKNKETSFQFKQKSSIIKSITSSTVSIYSGAYRGTGVILKKKENKTYILTCAHVIPETKTYHLNLFPLSPTNSIDLFKDIDPNLSIEIKPKVIIKKKQYIDGNTNTLTFNAIVLTKDKLNDICLLKIDSKLPGDEIDFYDKTDNPENGAEIYHVGNALGLLDDSLFYGIISNNMRGEIGNKMQLNISAVGGCSGGGVFLKDTGEYIGMMEMRTNSGEISLAISAKKIKRWLKVFDIEKNF